LKNIFFRCRPTLFSLALRIAAQRLKFKRPGWRTSSLGSKAQPFELTGFAKPTSTHFFSVRQSSNLLFFLLDSLMALL
jgi:hypothetical protein